MKSKRIPEMHLRSVKNPRQKLAIFHTDIAPPGVLSGRGLTSRKNTRQPVFIFKLYCLKYDTFRVLTHTILGSIILVTDERVFLQPLQIY